MVLPLSAMEATKTDIRSLSLDELTKLFTKMGDQPFRARQLHQWLWQKGVGTFGEMTNLSKPVREYLETNFVIRAIETDSRQISKDGTAKFGFRLYDDHLIEGVMIPATDRYTACVSSQVGCSLSCTFCATGFMDRMRNLNPDEIFDQVVRINQYTQATYGRNLSNIVFMGMGEPLLNYKNVLKGIEKITAPEGWGMSPKRITLSTAGIAKMIRRLADDQVKFNLALSLHAAIDDKRDRIMPINDQNNIEALMDALRYFYHRTYNKITFEYILFDSFNDSMEDAAALVGLCKMLPVMVNLIEYNPVDGVEFRRPSEKSLSDFVNYLEKHGVTVKVRRSRGKDIDAACGQLANKKVPPGGDTFSPDM